MTTDTPRFSEAPAWRLIPPLVLDGADNMALDEAMAARAAGGHCLARVYGWTRPTLSFGRHQRAAGEYDAAAADARGVTVVRRPTGGRAVLHWREITYCVAAPESALGSLKASYAAINAVLVAALRALGVQAGIARPEARAPLPGPEACFETPVAGEIVAGGRKLVGSAQWRADGALLQHGSILVDDDQPLATALRTTVVAPPPPPAILRDLMPSPPTLEAFSAALADAIVRHGGTVCAQPLDDALQRAMRERRERYVDDHWTWRR